MDQTGKAMNSISKQLYQLKTFFSGFSNNTKGIAATEFALILPFLVATYLGTVEICRAVIAKNKIEVAHESVSELVSRGQNITQDQLTDIFSLSTKMLKASENNAINLVVTAVRTLPNSGTGQPETKVTWSESKTGANTRPQGDNFSGLPDGMAANYETIIVTEMYYLHNSMYNNFINGGATMDRTFFTRPRYSSDIPCYDC